ncbi:MAG: N-acetyltransferase [Firmicutes bacterium]|nr:N-acetyltransferase [Bacillota bacterium]
MNIRKAKQKDMEKILEIYAYARDFMKRTGNPTQWGDIYPKEEMLCDDIEKGNLYVCGENDGIMGVFAFITGTEPTYSYIENGSWKNDCPYGTIHRIASAGQAKIFDFCIDFCKEKIENVRIDTHFDNKIMQRIIERNGFERCGVIYVEDGSPRIAYQFTGKK